MIIAEGKAPQGAASAAPATTIAEAMARNGAPAKARGKMHGRVRVFRNWCKGCGLCIAFCPQEVFTADDQHQPVATHQERCLACHWCTIHCPDFAIVVEVVHSNASEAAK